MALADADARILLSKWSEQSPATVFIVVTGKVDPKMASECLALGAYDFLTKPIERGRLLTTVTNALEQQALKKEITTLKRTAAMKPKTPAKKPSPTAPAPTAQAAPVAAPDGSRTMPLAEAERMAIKAAMEAARGNKNKAARILEIHRTTLYKKLREYGI
jgi:DNA-binding NtrC family response regulator